MGNVLRAGGRALSEEVPVGYKRTEVGVIPEDWTVTNLGNCGEIVMGQSPPGMSYNRAGLGSPLINGPTEFTQLNPVKIQWTTQPARFCMPGDLLICVRGSSTGRTNYADEIYAIGRGVAAIRAKADNYTQYLSYQVISGVSDLLAAATGSTFPSVDGALFRKVLISLPPPSEQRAIAEALSDVDGLLAALEALIAKKRAVKQAAMQQLLTGKTRLPGFSGAWETKRLEHIVDCLDHVRIPLNETQRADMPGPYPYCGANGVLDYVNDFILDDDVILIAEDGGYFDEYAHRPIAYRMSGKIWVNNHAHILKAKRGYGQGFLYFSLVHKNILPYLASGTRAKLNKSEMYKIEIYLPLHYAEQKAIAAVLSDIDAEIAALERRRDKARAVKQGMMQQLLTGRVRLVKITRTTETSVC